LNPLHEMTSSALFALSQGIQSGRVSPPFSTISLRRYCHEDGLVEALTQELQRFIDLGATAELIVHIIDVIITERNKRSSVDAILDIVLSGPEVSGTTFRDTGVVIQELFAKATESVLVAGYAVYQGKQVFRTLAERMVELPELKVQMYLDIQRHHKDTTRESDLILGFAHKFRTRDWPGVTLPEVYYDPRSLAQDKNKRSSLHAKCVVVDHEHVFISSANFTEAAQLRNIEVGVLMHTTYLATKLVEHFHALTKVGILKTLY